MRYDECADGDYEYAAKIIITYMITKLDAENATKKNASVSNQMNAIAAASTYDAVRGSFIQYFANRYPNFKVTDFNDLIGSLYNQRD